VSGLVDEITDALRLLPVEIFVHSLASRQNLTIIVAVEWTYSYSSPVKKKPGYPRWIGRHMILAEKLHSDSQDTQGFKPRKAAAGQKEMLIPIEGKRAGKEAAAKKTASKSQRKSA
jgi:hypothetical protein